MLDLVQEIIHNEFDIEKVSITPGASLRNDLYIDSMAAVNLSFEIEEKFNIKISDDELAGLSTVSDIVELLEKHGASPSW